MSAERGVRPGDETQAGGRTVYVVDADTEVRDGLRALLALLGYRVETFPSAEEFLARGALGSPACLITEVHLPGMSGLDLQAELTRRAVSLPTIVTTTQGDVPMAVQALRSGAVDFLEKPFVDRVLTERLEEAFARWRPRPR